MTLTTLLILFASSFSFAQENIQIITLEGVCSVEQVGSCAMTNKPFNVELIIVSDTNTGKFIATEHWENQNGEFEEKTEREWTGEILNKNGLRFKLETKNKCKGETRNETLHFVGVINCEEDNCKISIEDTYAMCPSMNCIFKIQYDLRIK